MLLVIWGADEIFEAIGGIYVLVVGLVVLLVKLERNLYADPSPSTKRGRTVRQSRQSTGLESSSETDDERRN